MRSLFRRISAREEGFSLVELMTASALLLTVMGAMFGLFVGVQRSAARQASRSVSADQIRLAMDRMTKELRQATQVRTTSTVSYLDIDTYVGGVETRVVYDATSGTSVTRTEASGSPITVVERLMDSNLFTYSSDPASGIAPSVIRVNLVVRPERFSSDGATVQLNSEVQLRNR